MRVNGVNQKSAVVVGCCLQTVTFNIEPRERYKVEQGASRQQSRYHVIASN